MLTDHDISLGTLLFHHISVIEFAIYDADSWEGMLDLLSLFLCTDKRDVVVLWVFSVKFVEHISTYVSSRTCTVRFS